MIISIHRWTFLALLLLLAGRIAAWEEKQQNKPEEGPKFYFGDSERINWSSKPEDETPKKPLSPGKRTREDIAKARLERAKARKKEEEANEAAQASVGKIVQRTKEGEKAVKELIKPWHHFKQEWWKEATVVIKGSYCRGSRRHLMVFPGGRAWWYAMGFNVSEVFKGEVASPRFPGNVSEVCDRPEYPRQYSLGRHYLMFLKPSQDGLKVLKDPKADFEVRFPSIGKGDFIAVIDLSVTEEHAEASRVQATRSGALKDFAFSPETWAKFRTAKGFDAKVARRLQEFLFDVVLTEGATLREVRSYLGEPDNHSESDKIYYKYYLPRGHEAVRVGDHAGWLEISFSVDLELETAGLRYMKCIEVDRSGRAWEELTAAERKKLGVVNENRSVSAK